MKKKVILTVLSICLIVTTFFFLQELLKPKYQTKIFEGNLTGDYYKSNKKDDVLFLGDCEVYENISPVAMYEDSGLTSYIRGNAQQLAWQSYYMLEDTLRYETPQVVVFNVSGLRHGERMNEAYNRMTLDDLAWSPIKIKAIQASMLDDESIWDYIFPIFRYHTRWQELTTDDFTYIFKDKKRTNFNGFIMNAGVKPVTTIPDPQPLTDYTLPETSMHYLDLMRELCEEKGIKLVLMKAPSLANPHWYDEWEEQIVDYADQYDLTYLNCIKLAKKIGINYQTDTYNAGLNLNVYGAEKLGSYIGKVLVKDYGITSNYTDESTKSYWSDMISAYDATLDDQVYELKKYGYLKDYGASAPEED